jgi:hypothetical protein
MLPQFLPPISILLLLLLLLLSTAPRTLAQDAAPPRPEVPCYAPDGVTLADDSYRPCNNLGVLTDPGMFSSCCRLNAVPETKELCDARGLCVQGDIVRRGFCTDSSWSDPACLNFCIDDNEVRVQTLMQLKRHEGESHADRQILRTAHSMDLPLLHPAVTAPSAAVKTTTLAVVLPAPLTYRLQPLSQTRPR